MMEIIFSLPEQVYIIELTLLFKMAISVLIGHLIGRERKKNEKPGGSRTFSLVCLSSALMAILTLELNCKYDFDFMRMMSYGLVGIGFIGQGIIHQNSDKIEGLTTASTLLVTVLIGYFIGLGYWPIGILAGVFTYYILESKYKRTNKE